MNKDDTRRYRRSLMAWYQREHRRLPWRDTDDPYAIWLSEVMLQQTQVQTVIPYFRHFRERFPTVQALAAANLQDVLKCWEGLGYYGRARNLHRAAGILATAVNGRIPDDVETFRKLPGVGPYIANAVLSIAFGRPLAVVDGNVKRVLSRLLLLEAPVNRPSDHPIYQGAADRLLDRQDPGAYNQAVMELGALICRPRSPRCAACPVQAVCGAFETGRTDALPVRVRPKPVPTIRTVTAVICRRGRMLVIRRPEEGLLGGLWVFPDGETKEKEHVVDTCRRVSLAETGLDVRINGYLATVRHAYTHFKVVTDVLACTANRGRVVLDGATAFQWMPPEGDPSLPFPGLHRKIMNRLSATGGCPRFEKLLKAI